MRKEKSFDKILKKYGQVKTIFYYLKDDRTKKPHTTVCLLVSPDGRILSRGISICSPLDSFRKKTGKDKALGRAIKALVRKISSEPIQPFSHSFSGSEERIRYLKEVEKEFGFKSTYLPTARYFEVGLLRTA